MSTRVERLVHIPVDRARVEGMLELPENARCIVLFAHGSGSSRHSPRNNYVAQMLRSKGIGTLLMDLLTQEEDMDYRTRFDIPLLTRRLLAATHWIRTESPARDLPVGYFGASTGAAAALRAAAELGDEIGAVVFRGGRPDMAGQHDLARVKSPTLLLVGGLDDAVIDLNREAGTHMGCLQQLSIVPGATHLFEEPGTLEQAAQQAAAWFSRHLKTACGSTMEAG